jgi:hypothetical protein
MNATEQCAHDFRHANTCSKCGIHINHLPPNVLAMCLVLEVHRFENGRCTRCGLPESALPPRSS